MALAAAAVAPLFLTTSKFPKHPPSINLHISISTPLLSPHSLIYPLPISKASSKLRFRFFSAVQEILIQDEKVQHEKIYVVNLPWDLFAPEIKNLFAECGTVKDVEVIKQKNGKSRGFAFVTMASVEEARAAIDKFDSCEMQGRTIRVEFAKSLKKPSPPPEGSTVGETRHKIFVSNLAWKVRSSDLREFFSAIYNPVSARVVFENPSGRSAGYGFVSFTTKEEADAAIAALDGKELMGRPIRLKISQRKVEESESELTAVDGADEQLQES
ncbi:28 kDa ribonucleoprotein, chloroplastic-like isoform X1 [Magnolia sinica]|uniref:28 kDa ribonucleoprotein, chloroplastic-like isoform X1 n=1 Tax=Magnolia sinica TaxID=86752 RepID=UPI002659DBEA|nr:28 kDa ribonucleoprotein, chloroplastic-like isoform X1 [Magnolia sinica]